MKSPHEPNLRIAGALIAVFIAAWIGFLIFWVLR